MADVGSFVGIDTGMFDQYFPVDVGGAFALMILGCDAARPLHQRPGGDVALQPCIDVSSASHFQLLKAFGHRQLGNDFVCDFSRSLAQSLRQLEGQWQGEFAHLHFRRLLDDDIRQVDPVLVAQKGANLSGEFLLLFQIHDCYEPANLTLLLFCGARPSGERPRPVVHKVSSDSLPA